MDDMMNDKMFLCLVQSLNGDEDTAIRLVSEEFGRCGSWELAVKRSLVKLDRDRGTNLYGSR